MTRLTRIVQGTLPVFISAITCANPGPGARADIIEDGQIVGAVNTDPFIIVGETAPGTLEINDGSPVTANEGLAIGVDSGASGSRVVVDGTGTGFDIGGGAGDDVFIGGNRALGSGTSLDGGTGTLIVRNGGSFTLTGAPTGDTPNDPFIFLGSNGGSGVLRIESGGSVIIQESPFGSSGTESGIQIGGTGSGTTEAAGTGELVITGAGSSLRFTGSNPFINVGRAGTGTLLVEDGGTLELQGNDLIAALNVGRDGTGTMIVDDAEVEIQSETGSDAQPVIRVGRGAGTGSLTVRNGGSVTLDSNGSASPAGFVIGYAESSNGTVVVTGAGSEIVVEDPRGDGFLYVGRAGTGTLQVLDGGTVRVPAGSAYVGRSAGSVGTLTVSGSGSTFDVGGFLGVGLSGGGRGSVTVSDGGLLEADQVRVGGNGTLALNGGTVQATTISAEAGSTVSGAGTLSGRLSFGGTVSPGNSIGTITVVGDTTFASGSVLVAEISPRPGVSDRIVVQDGSATIRSGAGIRLVPLSGDFETGATYTIVSADEGVVGSFEVVGDQPLVSLTQTLEVGTTGAGTVEVRVASAPGDRLIEEAPFNPVNGGPVSLLPRMATSDFRIGTVSGAAGVRIEEFGSGWGIGFSAGWYEIDGLQVQSYTIPLRYRTDLDRPGWQLILEAPVTVTEAEGDMAFSGSVGAGLRFPVIADRWHLTPTVHVGGVHAEDFNTVALAYGVGVTSSVDFTVGAWAFNVGNLIGFYQGGDVGNLTDDQIEYGTHNVTFRNGIVARRTFRAFGQALRGELFVVDTRNVGDDQFVQGYNEIGVSVGNREAMGWLPPVRVGLTATLAEDVTSVTLNAGYRF